MPPETAQPVLPLPSADLDAFYATAGNGVPGLPSNDTTDDLFADGSEAFDDLAGIEVLLLQQ